MYVDRNVNGMYDEGIDDQFGYSNEDTTDTTGDGCCVAAAKQGDLAAMDLTCAPVVEEDDDYYTFDSPTCTRRYDRATRYYKKQDADAGTPLQYEHLEHCLEEVLTP